MNITSEIISKLPGKDCGLCGKKTCAELAEIILKNPAAIDRCVQLSKENIIECNKDSEFSNITWKDHLNREYDFILDKFPNETGPRETILPFNPTIVEKLGIKKGNVLFGRPGWISCGCPVSHCGIVVEDPDYFNGTIVWCIVGPMQARERGINIGYYNTTAYEGLVNITQKELKIGMRYYFLPRFCMLQWRHCGLLNSIGKTKDGTRVRIEGLWIG